MSSVEKVMKPGVNLTTPRLRALRAAAVAGILFSILLITSFLLLRRAVPADPLEAGAWLKTNSNWVALALNLMPFADIAFLWFIGVLRDRLGEREDRFFATVFLGSGLLFLAMLFVSAALVGGIIIAYQRPNWINCVRIRARSSSIWKRLPPRWVNLKTCCDWNRSRSPWTT